MKKVICVTITITIALLPALGFPENKPRENQGRLKGKRIVMVIAQRMFQETEFEEPKEIFEREGATVVDVFVPNFDLRFIEIKNPTGRIAGIENPVQINDFLWSTGQMKGSAWFGTIHEQSLAIIQNDSIYLLTGCAHPGIVKIVERTRNYLPNKKIDLIIGGFHLMRQSDHQVKKISSKLKRLRVKKIAPSHCTGEQAIKILKEEWQENFIDFNIGNTTRI